MELTFTIQPGGLGRPLAGEDHISSLVTYLPNTDLPAGFTTTDRIKLTYSVNDAETLGIVSTSAVAAIKVLHYAISECYRVNKKAVLYIGLFDNTSIDYSKIETVQLFADKKVRQFGVVTHATAYNSTTINSLNTSCENMFNEKAPAIVVLGCDTSATALASLPDVRALGKENVSLVIGQDGAGVGAGLYTSLTKSIPNVGLVIGLLSKAKVNENIGWISKFNVVTGTEMDVPALGNGALVKNQTETLLTAIDGKGLIFFKKESGVAGTYANDSHTATTITSDFAYIESKRTIQKAIRGVRSYVTPGLGAPLFLNADGTLTEETIAYFKNESSRALEQMQRDGEISAFEVAIDTAQNVVSTSELQIGISVVPVGVARKIAVSIGFVTQLN